MSRVKSDFFFLLVPHFSLVYVYLILPVQPVVGIIQIKHL